MAENLTKKRMIEQDVAKGLAMVIVLLTHSLTLFTTGGRDTEVTGVALILTAAFAFIMPFFVFMAGYNYRDKGESYGTSLKKRVWQLVPQFFMLATALWVIMGAYMMIRGEISLANVLKSYVAFWIGDPLAAQLGLDASRTFVAQGLGPTWFIKYLITASIIFYAVVKYALSNTKNLFIVIFGLLSISAILSALKVELIWGIHDSPAVAAIMVTGAYFGSKRLLNGEESSRIRWINCAIVYVVYYALGIIFPRIGMFSSGRIDMVAGPVEVFVTEFVAIAGTYFMICICRPLSRVRGIGRFLQWFGRRSLIILIVHGSIMRICCDIMGITGQPNKLGMNNIIAFAMCLVITSLFLLIRDKVKENKVKK